MTTLPALIIEPTPMPQGSPFDIATRNFIATQFSPDTRNTYTSNLKKLSDWMAINLLDLQSITLANLIAFRDNLIAELAPSTVSCVLGTIKSFFQFLADHQVLPTNPASGLKGPKLSNQTTRSFLSVEDSQKILAAPDLSTRTGRRDKALLALMLINGLRECEIHRADKSDLVQIDGYTVLRVHGKGGRTRDAKIRPDVHAALTQAMNDHDGTALLGSFGNGATTRLSTRGIRRRVDYYLNLTQTARKGISGHAFRHTAITHALIAGKATIFQVQEMAGHASPAVTQRYAHNYTRLSENAVDRNPIRC